MVGYELWTIEFEGGWGLSNFGSRRLNPDPIEKE